MKFYRQQQSQKKVGISADKLTDFKKLTPYCSANGKKFAAETIESTFIKQETTKAKNKIKKEKTRKLQETNKEEKKS